MCVLYELSINIEDFHFGYNQLMDSLSSTTNFVNNNIDIIYITQDNVINNVIVQNPNTNNPLLVKEMFINKLNTNNFWLNYILARINCIIKIDLNVGLKDELEVNDYKDFLSEFRKIRNNFTYVDNRCKNILSGKSVIII